MEKKFKICPNCNLNKLYPLQSFRDADMKEYICQECYSKHKEEKMRKFFSMSNFELRKGRNCF